MGGNSKTGCVAYKYTCRCILNEMHGVNNAEVGGHLSRAADGTELREAAVSCLHSLFTCCQKRFFLIPEEAPIKLIELGRGGVLGQGKGSG